MDESRRFRFLIPVFHFAALVVLALFLDTGQNWITFPGTNQRSASETSNGEASNSESGSNAPDGKTPTTKANDKTEKAEPDDELAEPQSDGESTITETAKDEQPLGVNDIYSLLAIGGALLLAGYIVSSISATIEFGLRAISDWIAVKRNWQGTMERRETAIKKIDIEKKEAQKFRTEYLITAYHHGYLEDGIQDVLSRRWSYFVIGMNCLLTTIGAIVLCVILGVFPMHWGWWAIVGIVDCAILCNAIKAFRFVRNITRITFLARGLKFHGGNGGKQQSYWSRLKP